MSGDWLHEHMTALADEYGPGRTDLRTRAVRTARRTGVRRSLLACVITVVLTSIVAATAIRRDTNTAPRPVASPTTTPAVRMAAQVDLWGMGRATVPPGALDLTHATIDLPGLGNHFLRGLRYVQLSGGHQRVGFADHHPDRGRMGGW